MFDEQGNLVTSTDNEISINIKGDVQLLGLESGELSSHEDYKASKRKAYHGKRIAYLQPRVKNYTITFSAGGLESLRFSK